LFFGGLVLLQSGVIALSGYLASLGVRTLAIAGMILSVSGISLFLPFLAIPILVYPALGRAYLSGQPEVGTTMRLFSPSNFNVPMEAHLLLMLFFSVAGATATSSAIWRSGRFPRCVGVAYGIGFALTITDLPVIAWIGLALLVGAGARIAAKQPGFSQVWTRTRTGRR
jgi:hypothetical protein